MKRWLDGGGTRLDVLSRDLIGAKRFEAGADAVVDDDGRFGPRPGPGAHGGGASDNSDIRV